MIPKHASAPVEELKIEPCYETFAKLRGMAAWLPPAGHSVFMDQWCADSSCAYCEWLFRVRWSIK